MNKGELTEAIVREIGGTKKEADRYLTAITEIVAATVADGKKITLIGFGTFEARDRREREGRNPKTGEKITIPATTVPAFSAGKDFKNKVAKSAKSRNSKG